MEVKEWRNMDGEEKEGSRGAVKIPGLRSDAGGLVLLRLGAWGTTAQVYRSDDPVLWTWYVDANRLKPDGTPEIGQRETVAQGKAENEELATEDAMRAFGMWQSAIPKLQNYYAEQLELERLASEETNMDQQKPCSAQCDARPPTNDDLRRSIETMQSVEAALLDLDRAASKRLTQTNDELRESLEQMVKALEAHPDLATRVAVMLRLAADQRGR